MADRVVISAHARRCAGRSRGCRGAALAGCIQRHQPMHLAGEADAGDVTRVDAGLRQDGADTLDGAAPE